MALLMRLLSGSFLLVIALFSWPTGVAADAVLPIPEGPGWKDGQDFQALTDTQRGDLLAFFSGLANWGSQANEAPLSRQEKIDRDRRKERVPVPQPPSREKTPCKNFFWKTFSSC